MTATTTVATAPNVDEPGPDVEDSGCDMSLLGTWHTAHRDGQSGDEADADDQIGERRDRALTFVRRLSRAQMECLGLVTGDDKRDEARAGILAAGVLAHQEGRAVSVSFRTNHYSGRARYAGSAYTYRIVTDVVRELAQTGWIALTMAPVGQNAAKGRQSTYEVTAKTLVALGDEPVFELHLNDPVRLRGVDKRLMPYDDTEFIRERRGQLDRVNAMLARIAIGTRNPGIVKLPDGRWRLPGLYPDGRGGLKPRYVRSDAWTVHVVHNNADWDQNGRMTGLFIQQLSSADRKLLTIDGAPVVLLDYACSHLALAYARVGLQLEGDAYAIPGWEDERKFVKGATVTAINCAKGTRRKGWAQAVNAIAHDLAVREAKAQEAKAQEAEAREAPEQPAGKIRASGAHRQKARAVLKAIEKRHAPIREAFYSGMGLRFMRTEADVMLAVMLAAIDRGIPLLPVYDEFVVRVEDAAEVAELMATCWRERVGFEPMIDAPPVAEPVREATLSQNGETLPPILLTPPPFWSPLSTSCPLVFFSPTQPIVSLTSAAPPVTSPSPGCVSEVREIVSQVRRSPGGAFAFVLAGSNPGSSRP